MCVNPEHLFIGTNKDNALDCSKKKRNISQTNPDKIPKGENHGNAKLSNNIILEIIQKSKEFSIDELSKIFKIKKSYIRNILNGKIWNSVTNLPKYQTKTKNKSKEEWLIIAENLSLNNNGKLPKNLRSKGYAGLEACIKKYPYFFKHLLN